MGEMWLREEKIASLGPIVNNWKYYLKQSSYGFLTVLPYCSITSSPVCPQQLQSVVSRQRVGEDSVVQPDQVYSIQTALSE